MFANSNTNFSDPSAKNESQAGPPIPKLSIETCSFVGSADRSFCLAMASDPLPRKMCLRHFYT